MRSPLAPGSLNGGGTADRDPSTPVNSPVLFGLSDEVGAGPRAAVRGALSFRFLLKQWSPHIGWAALAAIVSQLVGFTCTVIAARLLGRQLFGEFGTIQGTVAALANIAGAGLGFTATRQIAHFKKTDPIRAGRVLGLTTGVSFTASCCCVLALFLLAPWISESAFKASYLTRSLLIACPYLFFLTFNGFQFGCLIGLETFRGLALINFLYGFVAITTTLLLTDRLSLAGALLALDINAGMQCLLYQVLLRSRCRRLGIAISFAAATDEARVLYEFIAPAALSGIVGQVAVWSTTALLVRQPDGFSQMGLFAAVSTLKQAVLFLPTIITRVSLPTFCRLQAENAGEEYVHCLHRNVVLNLVLTTGAAVGLVALGPHVLRLYGRGFSSARLVLATLVLSSIPEVVAWVESQVLVSHGKMWWQFGLVLIWSSLLVGLTAGAWPNLGALSLCLSYLGAWLVAMVLYVLLAQRLVYATGKPAGGHRFAGLPATHTNS